MSDNWWEVDFDTPSEAASWHHPDWPETGRRSSNPERVDCAIFVQGSADAWACIDRMEEMDLTRTPQDELRDYLFRGQPPHGVYRILVNYGNGAARSDDMRWNGHTANFSSGRTRASDAVRAEYAAEKVRLETAFRNSVEVVAHVELMAAATGLRRAVLELHGPERGTSRILCASCQADWEDYAADFPCDTYVLARDWEGEA